MQAFADTLSRTVRESLLGAVVGLLAGAASAGFLWALERVIGLRMAHPWLLFLLPVLGLVSAALYHWYGGEADGGGTLVLDEALEFRGRVQSRMAPLVLLGTLLTHLGGGSAGREGTAVQMGASLARSVGKLPWRFLKLTRSRQRRLLMAGVSAGFGSLFGTPVAGTVFGLEAVAIGKLHYEGLVICTAASFVADWTCRGLGAHHAVFSVPAPVFSWGLGIRMLLFAIPVALVAGSFSELAHGLGRWSRRVLHPLARPVMGGLAVVLLAVIFPQDGFLNLGLPWLDQVFTSPHAVPSWAFLVKLVFTAVTVGFGFKGGEVTPLFVMGALLGAACAGILHIPVPVLAAVGFIGVFAAASNTPIASTLMGIELFGSAFVGPIAVVSFVAYVLVGHRGIYGGHRIHTPKRP
ncbi:chloride channel protein [Geothrix sp. 21YS21S-4]|uniref:chloride channel protein n=1 Tax=Geothrix sp. 21YS21S-4 TaxID=3068889 RepID=UPI0027B88BCC|nr:chloride channel protein [Geothrix sp. 21YS21S-4]